MAPAVPRPTPFELQILRVLWVRGPSTVRDVHAVLSTRSRTTGYTTVLKMLQIMAEKGLVSRDQTQRAHVYVARVAETQAQRQLVRDLLERAFDGSASRLLMQALAVKKTTPEEIARIRKLLDELEEESR